jgi:hypothetical protein
VRRALVAAAAAGALLAPPASAHVTARPASLEARTTQRIFLEVPNERDAGTTTRVELAVPAGLEIVSAEAPPGWRVARDVARASWSGGAIEGRDLVDFPVDLRATGRAGWVELDVRQGYDDGAEVTWTPSLTILPAGGGAPKQRFGRALVASVVGIGVVAGSLVLLRRGGRTGDS